MNNTLSIYYPLLSIIIRYPFESLTELLFHEAESLKKKPKFGMDTLILKENYIHCIV